MRLAFDSYDDFERKNSRNHSKLSKGDAVQIRDTWKEKEFSGEQWWVEYVDYSSRSLQSDTLHDLLDQVASGNVYINNPGALIKIFEKESAAKVVVDDEELVVDDEELVVDIPQEILKKMKAIGGEALDSDGEGRYKVRVNGAVNWLTYSYIMNNL